MFAKCNQKVFFFWVKIITLIFRVYVGLARMNSVDEYRIIDFLKNNVSPGLCD